MKVMGKYLASGISVATTILCSYLTFAELLQHPMLSIHQLIVDTTAQLEHSQCPLVGTGSTTFQPICSWMMGESGTFGIELNGGILCTAYADQTDKVSNDENTSCSAAAYVVEGAWLIYCKQFAFFLCILDYT